MINALSFIASFVNIVFDASALCIEMHGAIVHRSTYPLYITDSNVGQKPHIQDELNSYHILISHHTFPFDQSSYIDL